MKTKRTLYLWLLFLIGGLVVGCDVDRLSPMDGINVAADVVGYGAVSSAGEAIGQLID